MGAWQPGGPGAQARALTCPCSARAFCRSSMRACARCASACSCSRVCRMGGDIHQTFPKSWAAPSDLTSRTLPASNACSGIKGELGSLVTSLRLQGIICGFIWGIIWGNPHLQDDGGGLSGWVLAGGGWLSPGDDKDQDTYSRVAERPAQHSPQAPPFPSGASGCPRFTSFSGLRFPFLPQSPSSFRSPGLPVA